MLSGKEASGMNELIQMHERQRSGQPIKKLKIRAAKNAVIQSLAAFVFNRYSLLLRCHHNG
jgi:hypothetical protein